MSDIPMQFRALMADSKVGRDIVIDRLIEDRAKLREALEGMVLEWDRLTRYGSPMAKAANVRVAAARKALEDTA
jgi:hypothetical protein